MQDIEISAVPNQSFFVRVDNVRFNLAFRECNGVMVVDIDNENEPIIRGSRVLPGEPLIPYAYLEIGNFVLTTSDDELPWWEDFGKTQKLTYLTAAEIAEY